MKNAIIFIIALAVSGIALAESPRQIYGKYAAPFGLEWGMPKEQVTMMGVKLTPSESVKDAYWAKNLPKKLSDAQAYSLNFKQGLGLIKAIAVTGDITMDVYGSKGKERYNQLKTVIANKYGKPKVDLEWSALGPTSINDEQFYQCLKLGCGHWFSEWQDEITNASIRLEIRGISRGTGYILLRYTSAASPTDSEKEAEKSRSDEDAL